MHGKPSEHTFSLYHVMCRHECKLRLLWQRYLTFKKLDKSRVSFGPKVSLGPPPFASKYRAWSYAVAIRALLQKYMAQINMDVF